VLLRLAGCAIRKSPTPRLCAIGLGAAEDLAGGVKRAAQLLALAGEIRIRLPRLHAHLAISKEENITLALQNIYICLYRDI